MAPYRTEHPPHDTDPAPGQPRDRRTPSWRTLRHARRGTIRLTRTQHGVNQEIDRHPLTDAKPCRMEHPPPDPYPVPGRRQGGGPNPSQKRSHQIPGKPTDSKTETKAKVQKVTNPRPSKAGGHCLTYKASRTKKGASARKEAGACIIGVRGHQSNAYEPTIQFTRTPDQHPRSTTYKRRTPAAGGAEYDER